MGSLVDSGIDPTDTAGLPEMEVMVDGPEEFEGGAEVLDDGEGGAIVQAIAMLDEMGVAEDLIPFDANLAEFLDDGTLGELSSELRGLYNDDLDSRSEWEETYTNGLDLLGLKTEERSTPFEGASGVTHPMISEVWTFWV